MMLSEFLECHCDETFFINFAPLLHQAAVEAWKNRSLVVESFPPIMGDLAPQQILIQPSYHYTFLVRRRSLFYNENNII